MEGLVGLGLEGLRAGIVGARFGGWDCGVRGLGVGGSGGWRKNNDLGMFEMGPAVALPKVIGPRG